MMAENGSRAKPAGTANTLKMLLFTILLGAFAGLVIWCFLKAVGVCTQLVWEALPEKTGNKALTVILCAVGGLLAGVLHKFFGNYPENLDVVMGKIKKEKHYDYHPMFIILLCAFIPLVFGASVGPEAGLTGIIAALCYWVGDNVSFAKKNTAVFSQVGEAVTLGQLFRSPLFGILSVEESTSENSSVIPPIPRGWKLLLYGLSTAASFLVIGLLNKAFGKAMSGFPSFTEVNIEAVDYWLMLVYIPVGTALFFFFEICEKYTHLAAKKIPPILREGLCGLAIGLMSLVVPMVLFSGEEQMAELMEDFGSYAFIFLMGICLLKMVMTAFCIQFGMKGGHFFPLIFSCVCMGYGLAMAIFADPSPHVVFASGIVTASCLGAQLKKPLAASVLLLLCFPAGVLFWLFLAAAIANAFVQVIMNRISPRTEKKRFVRS